MTFVSYAQNFEDVLLWRALHDVEHGRYLDVGAHDPVIDSVSLAFYEAGWRGIHVEPTSFYAGLLREARPDEIVIEAAVTDAAGPIPFYELGGLSSGREDIAEHHTHCGHRPRTTLVPTVGLDKLLELSGGDIHWLKIDVEGMEADVLRSWRECNIRPWILVVESTYPNSEQPTEHLWIDDVLRRGYQEVFFDGLSRYFLHSSHAELATWLNRPANVFDSYQITLQHFSTKQAREEASSLQQASEAREAQQATLILEQQDSIRAAIADLDYQRAAHDSLLVRSSAEIGEAQSRLEVAETALAADRARLDELSTRQRESEVELGRLSHELSSERETRVSLDAEILEIVKLTDADLVSLPGFGSTLRSVPNGSAYAAVKSRLHLATNELDLLRAHAERQYAAGHTARDMEVNFLQERISGLQTDIGELRGRLQLLLDERARTNALIGAVIGERPDRWQRVGLALRLTRPSSARMALASRASQPADATETPLNHARHQTTEKHMLGPNSIYERNPYLRANSLAELLSWDDVDFVRCAYVTVLGRQPDVEGEAFYTGRLRRGHAKLEVLWQLRRSPEGPSHDPGIAGFDRALWRARRARMRVVGAFFRILHREEGDSPADRRQRAMANDLHVLMRIREGGAHRLQMAVERLEERLQGFENRIASLPLTGASNLETQFSADTSGRRLGDPINLTAARNPEEVLEIFKTEINQSREIQNFRAGA